MAPAQQKHDDRVHRRLPLPGLKKACATPAAAELRSLAMDSVSQPNRRTVLAAAATGAFGLAAPAASRGAAPAGSSAGGGDDAIRPFSINIPEEALMDLRRRIN